MKAPSETTLVVGIGRPFGGDDTVGLVVAERLKQQGIDARTVTDGATLSALLVEAERVIVIDAIATRAPPGTVTVLRGDAQIRRAASESHKLRAGASVSSHGLSVIDALRLAKALGGAADVCIVGVVIDKMALFGSTLSPAVEAAVDDAIPQVIELLRLEPAEPAP